MDLQGGPTFEDLSINDELTQLQRLVRYSSSSIALQRLVHVKMLSETVAAVGFEQTVKSVVPLLAPLAEDQELVVRQHLGEQLEEIARFCKLQGKEAGYRLIIEIILPTLAKLLGDSQAEVRQAAGESLVGVANLMKPIDLGHHVLTIVLQLAHDDEQEELRMTAAALLNDLAEALGYDLCKQFVTPEMESLSEDPVFRVRKATALNLDKICKVVGEAGITRLLPAYVRLTKDDVYRVRKACTEALVEMSKAVGAEVSLRELTPVFLNLASDSSKLVRTGALQHLGRLISTLPGGSVSEDLVSYFTGTAVESMGDPVADAELRLYCAFSFPAVVVTIGPDRWHELRESFAALTRDPSWSVRKTLSYSLHEIAKVLKPDDVENDLVPAMEVFLRDMEDVRLGVIRQLADFFREMTPDQREKHLNVLVEILQTTSPFNWRLREVLAQQLPRLAPLLTPDSVFFAVVPVAFGLLNDPVAVVREKTFEVVAPLLQLAGAHSGARQASMVSRVRELAHAHTYQARQMYVYICHSMACSANMTHERPLFVQEFVPSLSELATDSVVNVRIAMSRALSKCPDWVMELPDIRRAIHHLVKDSNPDVRHFVSFLPPILRNDLCQEEKQQPGQETSSVLSDESVLTQWSVSTQRSMLSVGDFPPLRDASSPNGAKSIRIGRQRSSSVESVGESGYSTTSEEGEGLKRLTSRRPPLPAGWGLPAVSSAEPPTGGDSSESGASSGADDSGAAAASAAETKPVEGSGVVSASRQTDGSSGNPGPPASADGHGWGGGADGGGGGRSDVKGAGAGGGGGGGGRDDEQQGGAVVSSEADALMFGMQAAAVGTAEQARGGGEEEARHQHHRHQDDPRPAVPPCTRRASSQDPAVMDDDTDEEETGEGGVADVQQQQQQRSEEQEQGDVSTAALLSAKIADLTLSADPAGLAGANPDGMMPPTPLPDTRGAVGGLQLAAPGVLRQGPPLFGAAAEPRASTWGAGGGATTPSAGVAAAVEGGRLGGSAVETVVGTYPQQRSGLNLTPPPWEGSEKRNDFVPSVPSLAIGASAPSKGVSPPSLASPEESSAPAPPPADAFDADAASRAPVETKSSELEPDRPPLSSGGGGSGSDERDGVSGGSLFPEEIVPQEETSATMTQEGTASALSTDEVDLDLAGNDGRGKAEKEGVGAGESEDDVGGKSAPPPSPADLPGSVSAGCCEGGDGAGVARTYTAGEMEAPGVAAGASPEQPVSSERATALGGEAAAAAAAAEPTVTVAEATATRGEADGSPSSAAVAAWGGGGGGGEPAEDEGAVQAKGEAVVAAPGFSSSEDDGSLRCDPETPTGSAPATGDAVAERKAEGFAAIHGRQDSGVIEHKSVEPGGGSKEDLGDDAGRAWSKE